MGTSRPLRDLSRSAENSDLVMYWWERQRELAWRVRLRAGLITTNSITQSQNRNGHRRSIAEGTRVIWANRGPSLGRTRPDGAAVRVAMTVIDRVNGHAAPWER